MNYFPHNIGDFAMQTQYLTDEELGIFVRLRDHYLSTEMPLQCQWIALAMRTHCEVSVQNVLSLFFVEKDGAFHNDELDKIIGEYHAKAEKAAESARKRWEKTKVNQGDKEIGTSAMQTQCDGNANAMLTNNQKPITNNIKKVKNTKKEKVEKPDDVSEQTWNDFTELRKSKRAPITATAITRIENEAVKAGVSLEEALSTCCERGWQGFKAEWFNNGQTTVQNRASSLDNNLRFADRLIRDVTFCQTFFADRYDFDEMKQETAANLAHPTTFNLYKPHLIRLGLMTE